VAFSFLSHKSNFTDTKLRSAYINVFYLNLAEYSIRKINTEIGNVETFFDDEQNLSVAELLIKSSAIEFTEDHEEFIIKMFRSKKMTDKGDSFTPFDTVASRYSWDDKSKIYIKE